MRTTRQVTAALYDAFLAGDKDGMLAVMHEDVEIRFLGQAHLRGKEAASRFIDFSAGLLEDVRFSLLQVLVDGDRAASVWEERARTRDGHPWRNHGVDVVHVRDGLVVALHENNDVRHVYRYLPPYNPGSQPASGQAHSQGERDE